MAQVLYLDPAGNITAVVLGASDDERLDIAKTILSEGFAEQLGFEAECVCDAEDCLGRLEMSGGEFCGNASRAYAFYKAMPHYGHGQHTVRIEMTGVSEPISVNLDLDKGEAYTDMPLPIGLKGLNIDGVIHPLIRMEGIDHLLVERTADPDFAATAIAAIKEKFNPDACGIQFYETDGDFTRCYNVKMTPFVHVRDVDSYVWESSCGSGSVALAWHLACRYPDCEEFVLEQPGGIITVRIERDSDGKIAHCHMGGSVRILER